ncbi:hypothetical protein AA313_de0209905 [Arthrobotrys entomopaga]|nr:hypothetical protein AA313_de0209905 [Arthrobotrys entomopaga]
MDKMDIAKDSVQNLLAVLGLTRCSSNESYDTILIAMDFENVHQIIKHDSLEDVDSQIGFAILDTKNLLDSHSPPISTYSFTTGTLKYRQRASQQFLFGRSVGIKKEYLVERIESLFPRSRNIVLIGHDTYLDLQALYRLNPGLQTHSSIIGILDTQQIAQSLLLLKRDDSNFALGDLLPLKKGNTNFALEDLLRYFNCPYNKLHCAGNDAHFTLKLLLILGIHSVTDELLNGDVLAKLREISYTPIPEPKKRPDEFARDRKLRRTERKYQARFQGVEAIERKRAERVKKVEAIGSPAARSDIIPPPGSIGWPRSMEMHGEAESNYITIT